METRVLLPGSLISFRQDFCFQQFYINLRNAGEPMEILDGNMVVAGVDETGP